MCIVSVIEVHTAEPLILVPSTIVVEIANAKVKHKSPSMDQKISSSMLDMVIIVSLHSY
jgi:hypothetical protein